MLDFPQPDPKATFTQVYYSSPKWVVGGGAPGGGPPPPRWF